MIPPLLVAGTVPVGARRVPIGDRHERSGTRSGATSATGPAHRRFPVVTNDVLAASGQWPVIALAVAVAVALCLWGLFRRGSIADRARVDDGQGRDDD